MSRNESEAPIASRRALLGKLGAVAAGGVGLTLANAGPAFAGTDGDVVLGGDNSSGLATSITGTTLSATLSLYNNSATGSGLSPQALGGAGVQGASNSGAGIQGWSYGSNGVAGNTSSATASGVYGQNDGTGYGVAGRAENGTGVLADSTNGRALSVKGKAHFSRSGKRTISAGNSTSTVTLAGVTTSSSVFVTVQQHATGLAIESAVPAAGSFKIYLNKPAPTGGLKVAWFILD